MGTERETLGEMQVVHYETPDLAGLPKTTTQLAKGDILGMAVQVVSKEGGETNLHAHSGQDAVWFVLNGRAKFYGKDGDSVELGPKSALFIPKGVPYWFESASEEPLEIMRTCLLYTSPSPRDRG